MIGHEATVDWDASSGGYFGSACEVLGGEGGAGDGRVEGGMDADISTATYPKKRTAVDRLREMCNRLGWSVNWMELRDMTMDRGGAGEQYRPDDEDGDDAGETGGDEAV